MWGEAKKFDCSWIKTDQEIQKPSCAYLFERDHLYQDAFSAGFTTVLLRARE
jgi:hypothetical protein